MKKFLSVLLALAVAFTFTFGSTMSAFATVVSEDKTSYDLLVEKAADQVEVVAGTNYGEAVKLIADTDITDIGADIDADLWKAAAPIYQAKIAKLVSDRETEIKALYTSDKAAVEKWTLANVVSAFAVAKGDPLVEGSTTAKGDAVPNSIANMGNAIMTDADVIFATAKAYLTGVANDAVVSIKNIDTGIYSDTINKTTNLSSVAMAELVKGDAVDAIDKLNIANLTTLDELKSAKTTLGNFETAVYSATTGAITSEGTAGKGILDAFVEAKDTTYNVTTYAIASNTKYNSQSLVTKKEESDKEKTLDATKASYIARVNSEYAAYIKTATTAAQKEEAEAYKAGVTEIINAAKSYEDLVTIFEKEAAITAQAPTAESAYAKDKATITDLEVFANKYIAEGYDAEAINDIVALSKVAAYKAATEWDGDITINNVSKKAEEFIKAATVKEFDAAARDQAIANAEKALEAKAKIDPSDLTLTGNNAGYYAPELEKVTVLYNTIIAELKACTTDKEVSEVKTKYNVIAGFSAPKGLSDIAQADDVRTAIAKATIEWTTNYQTVEAYGNFLNALLDPSKDGYRDFFKAGYFTDADSINQEALKDFYATAGARTTAEATAMINDAKAALEAVKTNAEVKAAAKVVEEQIAALPDATAITAGDADAVKAAKDAYDTFVAETGSDISATAITTLNAALKAAGLAEKLAIEKEINAYADKTITASDEAAIKALLDKATAFNKEKTEEDGAYYKIAAVNTIMVP